MNPEYAALTQGAGLVDFSTRTQIEISGADRAQFLHNFCTNAVRDLPVGQGCEAFVLNAKGHIVGHVFAFVCPQSIVLETVPEQGEKLITHFDRYLIREDVQLADRSQSWTEWLLAGLQSESLLNRLCVQPPSQRMAHVAAEIAGNRVWIRNIDLAGPIGYLLVGPREYATKIQTALISAGATPCSDEAFQTARIEMGTPLFGQDITDENLPQEIDRNRQAISFTKGCYLGQETVARIDALGHVNRLLRGIKFSGQKVPTSGTKLFFGHENAEAKATGHITSSCWSPKMNAPLGLAMVRHESAAVGAKLDCELGPGEVVSLSVR
jgi:tRNA-modifying protein YgfZ